LVYPLGCSQLQSSISPVCAARLGPLNLCVRHPPKPLQHCVRYPMNRPLAFAISIISVAFPAQPQKPRAPWVFVDKQSISDWAKDTSTGKFEIQTFKYEGHSALVALKAFGKEPVGCEVWVFIFDGHLGWTEAIRVQPIHGYWPIVDSDKDCVILRKPGDKMEILRFSISQLQSARF
jgi:hypothetical protein